MMTMFLGGTGTVLNMIFIGGDGVYRCSGLCSFAFKNLSFRNIHFVFMYMCSPLKAIPDQIKTSVRDYGVCFIAIILCLHEVVFSQCPWHRNLTYPSSPVKRLPNSSLFLSFSFLQLPIRPHMVLDLGYLSQQRSQTRPRLASHSLFALVGLRSRSRHFARVVASHGRAVFQCLQQALHRLGRQILVVVVVDLHHGRIDARSQTLDLEQRKKLVFGGVAGMNAQKLLARLHDLVTPAAAEHARRRRADLDKVLAHRVPVVHGVESGHLVDAHRGHLEDARHLVHHGQARPSVLALAEVQDRHDGGLFVLGWVTLEDLIDQAEVRFVEFEWDRGVVFGCVAVLRNEKLVHRDLRRRCIGERDIPGTYDKECFTPR